MIARPWCFRKAFISNAGIADLYVAGDQMDRDLQPTAEHPDARIGGVDDHLVVVPALPGSGIGIAATERDRSMPAQSVLLYMYTPDLAGLREQLAAAGVDVPPIHHPEYMPSGEIHLKDPDGYTVLVYTTSRMIFDSEAWGQPIACVAAAALIFQIDTLLQPPS